jgi:hypothetical protein
MIRLSCLFVCALWNAASGDAQARLLYENRNQVDYGPLVVRTVSGFVFDTAGVSIPNANIGIFTEAAHDWVSQTTSDSNGYFAIGQLAIGEYRLVIQVSGLCSANAQIVVAGWPRGGLLKSRSFYGHMVAAGIDTCSFVTHQRAAQLAAGARPLTSAGVQR